MAISMTGYGRAEQQIGSLHIIAEMKSVNHRYFEANVRTPRGYAFLEEKAISFLKEKVSRGKIEVYITLERIGESDTLIEVNTEYADAYVNALKELREKYSLRDDISVSSVARNQEVFNVTKKSIDEDEITASVLTVLEQAVIRFSQMRAIEGERLVADITGRTNLILDKVSFIEQKSPETVRLYREKLEQKIKDLLDDKQIDEQRLITETAIFADKIAVDEETVRLRSHIDQLNGLLKENIPVGRKLDFIVQEMNRESNTIGSKAQNIDITNAVVDIKAEIEKIREQIQNIE